MELLTETVVLENGVEKSKNSMKDRVFVDVSTIMTEWYAESTVLLTPLHAQQNAKTKKSLLEEPAMEDATAVDKKAKSAEQMEEPISLDVMQSVKEPKQSIMEHVYLYLGESEILIINIINLIKKDKQLYKQF